jgi:uncharacterized protein (DUF1800 family)
MTYHIFHRLFTATTLVLLAACSGGDDRSTGAVGAVTHARITISELPTQEQASRLLAHATYGPTSAEITGITTSGYDAWLNDQFTKPQKLHRLYIDDAKTRVQNGAALTEDAFFQSFWGQVATGQDSLRQRITFALSQIFVISFQDATLASLPRGVASYYDTLGANAFGNYRDLLEAVTLHPMMGIYLTYLHNQKESGSRVPDENYAREIMQLFSIGLYELNQDGTQKLVNGKPVETYTNDDIMGLAKVFTGWSWAGPDKSDTRFMGGRRDPNYDWLPMQSYPQFHSISEKKFLGITIPAQGTPNTEGDLKIALDRLFNHPNVGPFIGRQLIQRLVTSNPSPQYVGRVAAAFGDNGQGVRGDMKAVLRAVLLDPEAQNFPNLSDPTVGKLREPILRLGHWMRSFGANSKTGYFQISNLDDPGTKLGQSPMRAPSVFNYYRPGYVPPNTSIANAGLAAPEFQITAETSVVGYLNTMVSTLRNGIGNYGDVISYYPEQLALVNSTDALIDNVNLLLLAGQMSVTLRDQIKAAVNSIVIPTGNAYLADQARKNRVYLAIYLTMASPEYLVQK